MTHVTCRLTAENWDKLQNRTLGNRVWATFYLFLSLVMQWCVDCSYRSAPLPQPSQTTSRDAAYKPAQHGTDARAGASSDYCDCESECSTSHYIQPRVHDTTADSLMPYTALTLCAFSALTLLVGRQEEHPVYKNWLMRWWCGYLSGARCRLFAYGPADASAIQKPYHLLPHINLDWFYLSNYRLTRVVLEKRPLNRCSSSSSDSVVYACLCVWTLTWVRRHWHRCLACWFMWTYFDLKCQPGSVTCRNVGHSLVYSVYRVCLVFGLIVCVN